MDSKDEQSPPKAGYDPKSRVLGMNSWLRFEPLDAAERPGCAVDLFSASSVAIAALVAASAINATVALPLALSALLPQLVHSGIRVAPRLSTAVGLN